MAQGEPVKVVALTGPESAGKSTLALKLKQRFGGLLVLEQVRGYIERMGRDTCYADIDPLARLQLACEQEARSQKPPLLLLDTHLLSNILWSQTLFGQVPDWLEPALREQHYDLHLLLDPRQVPWQADGMRCQPELSDRLAFYQQCRNWLEQQHQPWLNLDGSWAEREAKAYAAVQQLLNS